MGQISKKVLPSVGKRVLEMQSSGEDLVERRKRRFMDAVKDGMKEVVVAERDEQDRRKWRRKICCGDTEYNKEQLRKEKDKCPKIKALHFPITVSSERSAHNPMLFKDEPDLLKETMYLHILNWKAYLSGVNNWSSVIALSVKPSSRYRAVESQMGPLGGNRDSCPVVGPNIVMLAFL